MANNELNKYKITYVLKSQAPSRHGSLCTFVVYGVDEKSAVRSLRRRCPDEVSFIVSVDRV